MELPKHMTLKGTELLKQPNVFIHCFVLTQTFVYREMDVFVMGGNFNYLIAPGIYYVGTGFFGTFCIIH